MNRSHTWEFEMNGSTTKFYSRARARTQRKNLMRRHPNRTFGPVRKAV